MPELQNSFAMTGRGKGMAGFAAGLLALVLSLYSWAAHAGASGRVFLTFDDGPIDATLDVLDVLKAEGIKATFFINAIHLDGQGGEKERNAQQALRRIVAEGHVLGNHAYDHMGHNRLPGNYSMGAAQAYRDVETDIAYFIPGNITPVNKALGEQASLPNNRMSDLARLPFSNVWMLPGLDQICRRCASGNGPYWHPDARANAAYETSEIGGELAKVLLDDYQVESYGWDVQWRPTDWALPDTNETLPPASSIEQIVVALIDEGETCLQTPDGLRCKSPIQERTAVVLTHDFLFENGPRGRGKDFNLPQLAKLIASLKTKGYAFDTLDHYLHSCGW